MIFGRSGSGKSSFAYKLSQKIGIALYHLDKYFFVSNWIERDTEEFMKIQNELVSLNQWIIDGNSTRSLETRWQKADLVLYFNFSIYTCLYRSMKRLFFKNKNIDDRAPSCPEKVSFKFFKYIITFSNRVDSKIVFLKNKYPNVKFIEINNDKDLKLLEQTI